MIDDLRKLISAYDMCYDINSPATLEISMWRKRFLESEGNRIDTKIRLKFMSLPAKYFVSKTPEQVLHQIEHEEI